MELIELLAKRRSIYDFANEEVVSNLYIVDLIKQVVAYTPSAFNAQTQRVMILLGQQHTNLWELTLELLKPLVPASDFEKTSKKIGGLLNATGTVLFFDDEKTTEDLCIKFPLYAKNFEVWSTEQNGMLQQNIWNLFTSLGLGASLHHYNEVIEEKVKNVFDVPSTWKLVGQMPFGKINSIPASKPSLDINTRVLVRR